MRGDNALAMLSPVYWFCLSMFERVPGMKTTKILNGNTQRYRHTYTRRNGKSFPSLASTIWIFVSSLPSV